MDRTARPFGHGYQHVRARDAGEGPARPGTGRGRREPPPRGRRDPGAARARARGPRARPDRLREVASRGRASRRLLERGPRRLWERGRRRPAWAAGGLRETRVAPTRAISPSWTVTVRDVLEADLGQIAAIWNHEALRTHATTDTAPRDGTAQREWLARHTGAYPALVAAAGDEVLAYGSLSPYRPKPAFARTVEDSVYVKRGHRGAGLGSLILGALIERAREVGHHSVLARITSENAASLRLHERHGFRLVGVEYQVAFKLGRWLDVTIMQRLLHPSCECVRSWSRTETPEGWRMSGEKK